MSVPKILAQADSAISAFRPRYPAVTWMARLPEKAGGVVGSASVRGLAQRHLKERKLTTEPCSRGI